MGLGPIPHHTGGTQFKQALAFAKSTVLLGVGLKVLIYPARTSTNSPAGVP